MRLSAQSQKHRGDGKFTSIMELADGRTMELERIKLPNGYTVSVSHDVSDIVEMDGVLQDALLLGNSGYWIYDIKSKIYTVSESLKEFIGNERLDDFHKDGIIAVVHPDDIDEFRVHFKRAMKSQSKVCLLYTSPSPRDATLSRMPSSA